MHGIKDGMFDQQLGRWHVPDPMQQYMSPYVGMGNRPSSNIDPNGMWSDAAYRSDLRGYDAYRLSKFKTYMGYNRKTDVMGVDPRSISNMVDLTSGGGYDIGDWVIMNAKNTGIDAYISVTQKTIVQQITEALQKLQDEAQVHAENSLAEDGSTPSPCPPPQDDGDDDGNSVVSFSFDGKVTLGIQAGGTGGILEAKTGLFVNIWSLTLIGYDTKENKLTYPTSEDGYSETQSSVSAGYGFGFEAYSKFDATAGGYQNHESGLMASIAAGGKYQNAGLNVASMNDGRMCTTVCIPIRVALIIGVEINLRMHFYWDD